LGFKPKETQSTDAKDRPFETIALGKERLAPLEKWAAATVGDVIRLGALRETLNPDAAEGRATAGNDERP
jgi:hypothetical protein